MRTHGSVAQRGLRDERGIAAVELALVLPLFAFLMLATGELGHALYQYNTLTKSVRDGAQFLARYGVTAGLIDVNRVDPGNGAVTVSDTAKNLVVYGSPTAGAAGSELLKGMTIANVTIQAITVVGAGGPTYVKVTATYPYTRMFGAIPILSNLGLPGTMTASTTMVGL